jgi:hypothetical protein
MAESERRVRDPVDGPQNLNKSILPDHVHLVDIVIIII